MRNLLLHIAYNGSRYHGYQVQQNAVSVAGTFQPVLEKILAEKVQLKGCSRTDTGVHANDFAVSFKTNCRIPCEGLVRALNNDLPPDMAALRCEEVDEEFHARKIPWPAIWGRCGSALSSLLCWHCRSSSSVPVPACAFPNGSSMATIPPICWRSSWCAPCFIYKKNGCPLPLREDSRFLMQFSIVRPSTSGPGTGTGSPR